MVKAYEELPDYVKAQIADLRAKASIEHSFGAVLTPEAPCQAGAGAPHRGAPRGPHPPETGEKILFVGAGPTSHFVNWSTPANVRHGIDKSPGASLLLDLS